MPVGSVLGAMALLILYQPDLGTTVSICIVAFSMLFAAGLSLQYIGLSALVATPVLYVLVWLVPYRRARVLAFLDPWADPLGSGFQIIQSLIAVGTGGVLGRGLMEGPAEAAVPARAADRLHLRGDCRGDRVCSARSPCCWR